MTGCQHLNTAVVWLTIQCIEYHNFVSQIVSGILEINGVVQIFTLLQLRICENAFVTFLLVIRIVGAGYGLCKEGFIVCRYNVGGNGVCHHMTGKESPGITCKPPAQIDG